uniref:Uncharacterized protein n=1 Tax=Oryza sativa subsp. japonica TaxID=39947 RepID=Q53WP1_ORYSJ|nr:unknown protein [Oryza sativa Japonica Group]
MILLAALRRQYSFNVGLSLIVFDMSASVMTMLLLRHPQCAFASIRACTHVVLSSPLNVLQGFKVQREARSRTIDARQSIGRRTTSHAVLNAAVVVGTPPINALGSAPSSTHSAATWQPSVGPGATQPLGPEGCNGIPRDP